MSSRPCMGSFTRARQQRRHADLHANQEIPGPPRPRVADDLAAHGANRLDARGLQRGDDPEEQR